MEAFTTIREVGEFGLIDRIRALTGDATDPDVLRGISDDAAVYRIGGGRVHVVTTDALVEGIHFDPRFTPLRHLGVKAVAVNVSDVAAMNARPRFLTIALGLPSTISVEMVEAFYAGVKAACDAYGCTLLGGDTTAAHRLTLSVTAIGEAEEDAVAYRSGAKAGDLLVVTGDLGAAYAGLKVLRDEHDALQGRDEDARPDLEPFTYVIGRHLAPTARVQAVAHWAEQGVRPHALIDISDGLAAEVHHLCRNSGCGALVHAPALPIDLETRTAADRFSDDVDAYALFGGDDYELLAALAPDDFERLDPELFAVIGRFTAPEEGIQIRTPEGETIPLHAQGFQHFGSD